MDRKLIIENAIERIKANSNERQVESGKLLFRALEGDHKAGRQLAETISTSDIPAFMTPAINAIFLAEFADAPVVWNQIAEEYRTDRFNTIEWYGWNVDVSALEGGELDGEGYNGYGLPGVAELGEYPMAKFKTETLDADLRKWGLALAMSWETSLKTGDFAWLPRIARQFARYAAEAEDVALAKEFVSSAGVVNADFTDAVGNPALTLTALEDAILQSQSVRVNDRRTNASRFKLVTGYGQSLTARQILNTTQIERAEGTDILIQNPTLSGVDYVAFDALDKVGGATVDDYWFVVPQGSARPAFLELFHQDYRTPLISIKAPNHMTVGGGMVDPLRGDFERDAVAARVSHVVSAHALTPQIVVASTGAGA